MECLDGAPGMAGVGFCDILGTPYTNAIYNRNLEMGDETVNRLQKKYGVIHVIFSCGEKNLLYHFILYYVRCR